MKKFLFYAAAIAAVAMVSCSKDDDESGSGSGYNDNGDDTCTCTYSYGGYDVDSEFTMDELTSIGSSCQNYYNELVTASGGYGTVTCK